MVGSEPLRSSACNYLHVKLLKLLFIFGVMILMIDTCQFAGYEIRSALRCFTCAELSSTLPQPFCESLIYGNRCGYALLSYLGVRTVLTSLLSFPKRTVTTETPKVSMEVDVLNQKLISINDSLCRLS